MSREVAEEGPHRVVRSVGWNIATATLWVVMGLLCVAGAVNANEVAARVVLLLFAAGCGVFCVRAVVAGAGTGPGGVVVRGFFRTRSVAWSDIVEIGPSFQGGSSCVGLKLRSGEVVPIRGCASYSTAKLREFAESIGTARPVGAPTASPRE